MTSNDGPIQELYGVSSLSFIVHFSQSIVNERTYYCPLNGQIDLSENFQYLINILETIKLHIDYSFSEYLSGPIIAYKGFL